MPFKKAFHLIATSLLIAGCGGGGGDTPSSNIGAGTGSTQVTVTDSASLSRAASFENGTRMSGSAPIPAAASGTQMEGPAEIPLTTNSVSELIYEVTLPDTDSKIGAVIVEFANANEYFVIVPEAGTPRVANRSIPAYTSHSDLANGLTANRVQCVHRAPPCEGIQLVGQPLRSGGLSSSVNTTARVSTVITETFDFPDFSTIPFAQIQPDPSRWTQPLEVDVSATPTGSGDLQITLTWNTSADMDLHIFEPGGSEINWTSTTSAKGFLDVDDVDGFGPENVFYEDGHDSGNYRVEVHHFSGTLPTNYTVTITDNGATSTYSGSVTSDGEEDVATSIASTGSTTTGSGTGTGTGGTGTGGTGTGGTGTGGTGTGGTGTGGTGTGGTGTGSGTADFCYTAYPADPCDLLVTQGGAISSSFTTANTCSGLGYNSTNSTDFGTQFGTFGQSSSIGIVGTCEITF